MAKTKRRPTLIVRVTDDFKVNLKKKYWFIEVEDYFWTRFATKHFKNITFKEWLDYQLRPLKKTTVVRILSRKKPRNKQASFAVGGLYDAYADSKKQKAIWLAIYRFGWPAYSRSGVKERLTNLIIKTIVHELNHTKQSRIRNYHMTTWDGDYYENPDEVDSYALNSAQSLVARFGVTDAKIRASKFCTKDSHCKEFIDYFKVKNIDVRQKFIKRVLKYISIYESYEQEYGKDKLLCYHIRKKKALTRKRIKKQINA